MRWKSDGSGTLMYARDVVRCLRAMQKKLFWTRWVCNLTYTGLTGKSQMFQSPRTLVVMEELAGRKTVTDAASKHSDSL